MHVDAASPEKDIEIEPEEEEEADTIVVDKIQQERMVGEDEMQPVGSFYPLTCSHGSSITQLH